MAMISKRAAVRAGKTLNEAVERLNVRTPDGLRTCRFMTDREVEELAEAVRVANEIIYQHYGIPKDVREFWHTEVGADGIPVQDLAQE